MKKNIYRFLVIAALAFFGASCQQELPMEFDVESTTLEDELLPADGGIRTLNVTTSGKWVVKTVAKESGKASWVTVSPANGFGPTECKIIVDSTLKFNNEGPREALVSFMDLDTKQTKAFTIKQEGYKKMIVMEDNEMTIKSLDDYEKRKFEIKVKTNVDFDVVIPQDASEWLEYTIKDVVTDRLDRQARPREIPVEFRWKINFTDNERPALIKFEPKDSKDIIEEKSDFNLTQEKAAQIKEGTPEGDRDAILAILNSLNSGMQINTAEKLENWDNVTVWTEGENKGRVKSVRFEMFSTKEPIPFQVKYLTACEEMVFYSNTNSFLYSLSTGKHLSELTQLKRLTIGAYGLTELDPSFVNLKNLEFLNLEGNNFQEFPEILNQTNFPKLHAIMLHSNQRHTILDLSNTVRKNYGGLEDSCIDKTLSPLPGDKYRLSFPRRLLEWENLDTLRLSVNYLQGELPSLDEPSFPKWKEEDLDEYNMSLDTLGTKLLGLPRVLPKLNYFAINLNKLSGKVPDWLLFHPKFDLWIPFSLVFPQEGFDKNGHKAGFDPKSVPSNFDYYYEVYPNKKFNPKNQKDED